MTREEAIKVIHKMLAYTDLSVRANLNADMVNACHMAIEALEQEPVLDKVRAEIAELSHYYPMGHDYQIAITRCIAVVDKCKANCQDSWSIAPNEIKKDVLTIIDKYKTESEDNNTSCQG